MLIMHTFPQLQDGSQCAVCYYSANRNYNLVLVLLLEWWPLLYLVQCVLFVFAGNSSKNRLFA